jgi:hypothetical protein
MIWYVLWFIFNYTISKGLGFQGPIHLQAYLLTTFGLSSANFGFKYKEYLTLHFSLFLTFTFFGDPFEHSKYHSCPKRHHFHIHLKIKGNHCIKSTNSLDFC